MLRWFRDRVETWKARRKLEREINPETFKRMASDIRDLAVLASQLAHDGRATSELAQNVIGEMDRLNDLADRPEFRRLSTGKRLLLRKGLMESRHQLLESIESAPSPTERLQ